MACFCVCVSEEEKARETHQVVWSGMLHGKGQQPSWLSFPCDTPEVYPAEKAGPLAGRQTDRQTAVGSGIGR